MDPTDTETLPVLAMRLRRATAHSPIACMEILRPWPEEIRLRYVEYHEENPGPLLCDPIEFDFQFEQTIESVAAEAKKKLEAGELGNGHRGRSVRMWGWMKNELLVRHQISWRTPLEMSPMIAID